MSKLLEKALKDAVKKNTCVLGTKQVSSSLKNSKLVVISKSMKKNMLDKIQSDAKKAKVPTMNFQDTSISLGKLCGLQFRVSTVSFNSLSEASITSIKKEAEKK